MRAVLFLFFLFGAMFVHSLRAQDFTIGKNRSVSANDEATVLLIPYEPKMYIADVTRELCTANELDANEIRRILREGLSQLVATEIGQKATVIDLLNEGDSEKEKDIMEIYSATSYQYIKVPEPDTSKVKKESPDQVGRGTYLKDGQLRSYYDGKERFMDATIVDKNLPGYLKTRYQPDYIVFLNELDIRVLRNGPPMPGEQRDRQIKVHYTIFNAKGKKLTGNAVMLDYPYGKNNVFDIVREYFTHIGESITEELFPETPVESKPMFTLPGRGR